MAFLQGTDGNDVLGGTKLDEPLLGPGAIPALLAFGGSDHVFGDQLSVPVLPLLTPLEPIAHGHDFLLAGNGVHILSGSSDFFVVDANLQPHPLLEVFPLLGFGGQLLAGKAHAGLAPGVSPIAVSREHGGATYAVA
jgi:hypothetical protein